MKQVKVSYISGNRELAGIEERYDRRCRISFGDKEIELENYEEREEGEYLVTKDDVKQIINMMHEIYLTAKNEEIEFEEQNSVIDCLY